MAKPKNSKLISTTSLHHYNGFTFFHHYIPSSPSSSSHLKTPRRPPPPMTSLHLLFFSFLFSFSLLTLIKIHSLHLSRGTTTMIHTFAPAPSSSESAMAPHPLHGAAMTNASDEEWEFWRQPDGLGYRPCTRFSVGYRKASARIARERRRFLVAEVNGGLNQQRSQIVDAVVIARVLGAALVVPILQVNVVWGDTSKFSDIFDVDHFKQTLQPDVRIVSSLPPEAPAITRKNTMDRAIPLNASPLWIRTRFLKQLRKNGVLVLKGFDSKLSKDLPLDLQRLRCKVAFNALRFAAPIRKLGEELVRRMRSAGPYVAVHLRLEEDVWVRTGCLPGLGRDYDEHVVRVRRARPELLTGSPISLTSHQRLLAGLCPLNARDVARLLRALGAPRSANVYWAGGRPLGGESALRPLKDAFPNFVSKETLASVDELEPFADRPSALAALDFVVALGSDVFLPSHGGNMGEAIQGHRAYAGHRKHIRPNKRALAAEKKGLDFDHGSVRRLHRGAVGQPVDRTTRKRGHSVTAYPVPECMCRPGRHHRGRFLFW